ncbi:hypothetical protein [Persicitalea jodogahamensis]|uniref:Uncharacterized protein n=1 Tax=Persicitalea jodogahamensis TaxID=402147 RepID=A0A8J3D5V0_9BACT|nr:hypothetical protein [Persicitalea jodogahamensis]GHB87350.1 hypothetical protein GCM10007390_48990 [Persicitalea jodogahamensis]
MTFLTFLQIGCVVVFAAYVISVNMFKGADNPTGARPEPEPFTFFPKKRQGLIKEQLDRVLDPEGRRNETATKP